MSEPGDSQPVPAAREYLEMWAKSIADGLGRMMGSAVNARLLDGEKSSQAAQAMTTPEGGLWLRLFAGKAGEQAFFIGAADALRFSQSLLAAPPAEAASLTPDAREAAVQFFQQIATMIPAAEWLGFQGEIEASEAERPQWESAAAEAIHFSTPEGPLMVLHALLSADFVSTLQAAKDRPPTQREALPPKPAPAAPPHDINLDLLMDVELEVRFRFGQRDMILGDILALVAGSVVELDQQVQDPVELMIGNRVIAWGEVVSVDGNYGLRVTGLASREERIESLRK